MVVYGEYKKHELYQTWTNIKSRCFNTNDPAYPYYGGRGITMCDRWRHSFPNFVEDVGERPKGLSIDRINNDGNYEPGNVRWANKTTQMSNRRTTKSNVSGYKYITRAYRSSRWVVVIARGWYVGTTPTLEEALKLLTMAQKEFKETGRYLIKRKGTIYIKEQIKDNVINGGSVYE